MTQCSSCGGTYQTTQVDGTQYFHRCPPLSLPELVAAVAAGKIVMVNGETPAQAILLRTYERNALRDENLKGTKATDAGTMKALGKGVTTVADPPSPVIVAAP